METTEQQTLLYLPNDFGVLDLRQAQAKGPSDRAAAAATAPSPGEEKRVTGRMSRVPSFSRRTASHVMSRDFSGIGGPLKLRTV